MLNVFRATVTILSVILLSFDVPSIIKLHFALLSVGITSVVMLSVVTSFEQKFCVGVY
jgi:hypothetical protein